MSDTTGQKQARINRRFIFITAAIALSGGAIVWNILPPDVPHNPIVLARETDGTLKEQGNRNDEGLAFNAHLGELKSQNQTFTSSSSGHSNPAFFAARHLIIINQSDDVLMERIGAELLELLKKELAVDRLEYYPFGHVPETGGLSPDFYVTLDLESKQVSGLLNGTLEATVKANLGSSLAHSSFSSFDDLTPPLVRLNAEVEVRHQSTYVGVESSSAAYQLQGKDIAKQLATQLKAKFDEARDGHGTIPQLPDKLAKPDYSAIPEFAFLDELDAKVVTSTHRLMMHNETFWRLTSDRTVDQLFKSIKEGLAGSEWRVDHEETKFLRSAILRFVDRPRVLMIFPADREDLPTSADDPQPENIDYFVHYRHRVSRDVLESTIDDVLAQTNPDINFLLAFRGSASGVQHSRIIARLEQQTPGTAAIWSTLADHYSSRKDIDGCRLALRMLTCLNHLSSNSGPTENKIRQIAKKHDIDKSEYETPARDDWLKLGLVELTEDGQPEPIEFGLDTRVGFFDIDHHGKVQVYSIVITNAGTSKYEAVQMKCSGGSRSWTSGAIFTSDQKTARHSFGFNEDKSGRLEMATDHLENDQFRTTLRVLK